ncbi:hypothetical protein A3E46_01595 [Candidatus Woesebacteria bacterium RIFCSPHIGHO2_12_FULL_46_16]|uniref:Uncharacterized protein n=1 Tax=Candidatus Woesebacteria bacterium RIFCSPHIGHO2_12_FULL_46_16 TaxID=1802513 RepID=A0A1F8AXL0_9BACT|nr:MAG: hypothetical protein A3E46_01595 [Candidatus Woesebacteria bacterium RIFCSPHIGHO2_12_FULL_46_16]
MEGLSIKVGKTRIPTWNTPGRPKKPKKGTFGFNSQTNSLEFWNGSVWLILRMIRLNEHP